MKSIIVFLGLILIISSCKHEPLVKVKENTIDCSEGDIDFVNQVFPILQTSCATSGCHDESTAKDGVVLDVYSKIIETGEVNAGNANSSELYDVLNGEMPPPYSGYTITQNQKNIIENWINQGAKNTDCSNQQLSCDSVEVSFSNNVVPILDSYCVSCHTGSGASANIWLDNYSDVKLNADNGSLLGSIMHNSSYVAMPYGLSKLNECDIAIIKNWIAEGTLNN